MELGEGRRTQMVNRFWKEISCQGSVHSKRDPADAYIIRYNWLTKVLHALTDRADSD
jgi:hypothetical protein